MTPRLRGTLPALLLTILVVTGSGCASSAAGTCGSTMPQALEQASSTESHEAAAKELLRLSFSQETLDALISLTMDGMLQANPMLQSLRPVFDQFFAAHFTVDNMVNGMAPLYVARFTELELRQMTWFYSTPVGARALAEMPELTAAGGTVGEQIVRDHQAELEQMIQQHLAKQQ